ncbi:MAG: helix-hairpin-helix domain-containing protein [Candidatus Omnitrophota bacterium]
MYQLTPQERRAVLFLICLALIGLAVNYAVKLNSPIATFLDPGSGFNKININRAGYQELLDLKGLTPSLAGKIIEYRQENGPFEDLRQLKKVKGIGERRFERIKDCLTLD